MGGVLTAALGLFRAAELLRKRGWLGEVDGGAAGIWPAIERALREFQSWYGLPATGNLTPETQAVLAAVPFCGHPDRMPVTMEAGGQPPKRTDPLDLTWYWQGPAIPGLPDSTVEQAIQAGFDAWAVHSPLRARKAAAGTVPDVVVTAGRIDGPFGTLAWMELPTTPNRQQRGKLDAGERWDQSGGVPLVPVLTHELGHFLGLGHIPGNGTALMNPSISTITKPTGPDIPAIQALYGSAGPVPPIPPTPSGVVTIDPAARVITAPAGYVLRVS
jgi:hypothetical protein